MVTDEMLNAYKLAHRAAVDEAMKDYTKIKTVGDDARKAGIAAALEAALSAAEPSVDVKAKLIAELREMAASITYAAEPSRVMREAADALTAQVQDDDEQRTETCQRCHGNGEIVTDWDRYLRGHEDENGNEAVAECPDCDGEGRRFSTITDEMVMAGCIAAYGEEFQKWPENSIHDGKVMVSKVLCAALPAAPAKQEGKP